MGDGLPISGIEAAVARACLAPSIHNTQPWRWDSRGGKVWLWADLARHLPQADPDLAGMALSCGAALEAFVLAMSAQGIGAEVQDGWAGKDLESAPGYRLAAQIKLGPIAAPDPLAARLEQRFTWRGAFAPEPVSLFGWTRADAQMVMDAPGKRWLGDLNDASGLSILRQRQFRRELLRWMRLRPGHSRSGKDGMDLAALRMPPHLGRWVRLAFGPLWPFLDMTGQTASLAAESSATQTSAAIALFHRPLGESPVTSGRAYLRLWLEATSLGMAGWPMAALTDDAHSREQIVARYGIGPDRRLIQAIRFGRPSGEMPPRARRPMTEVFVQDRSQSGQP